MKNHILAVHSYGSHRVKNPSTKKIVSAQKIGHTSAAADLLLALYGDLAQDVSSKRASYRYIQITGETTVRHGYLLLKLNDVELAQAEALTKLHQRAGAYLYRDGKWLDMPNQRNPEYSQAVSRSRSRSGPNFTPIGYRIVTPANGEKEAAIESITVEVSQRSLDQKPWHWIIGDTYPHRELLRDEGARWSKKRRAWYLIAWELPNAIQQLINEHKPSNPVRTIQNDAPCSDEEAEQILGVKFLPKPAPSKAEPIPSDDVSEITENDDVDTDEEEIPSIRIIKPQFSDDEPDLVQTAIQQVKSAPIIPTIARSNRPTHWQLPQEACGELTGSITGQVWCYSWAIYDGICIFVSMGGPRMAVEAIRAKFSKGDIVNLIPDDAPALELTAGEGNTGMYIDYLHNMPEAKFTSLMLAHEMLVQPNYAGKSTTFIFHLSDEQAMAQLKHHVTELVNVPVFNQWSGYLWQAGQNAMLLRKTRSNDCLKLWTIDLDVDAWTRLITGGLSEKIIQLPEQQ